MAPTSVTMFFSSPLTITALPSRTSLSCTKEYQKIRHRGTVKLTTTTCGMWSEGNHGSGRLVDENMIVLRKRIHETKMIERNYEPPAEWMVWEKSVYTSYDSVICEAMGILQSRLMDTRPSLALGLIALVTLSVPTTGDDSFDGVNQRSYCWDSYWTCPKLYQKELYRRVTTNICKFLNSMMRQWCKQSTNL